MASKIRYPQWLESAVLYQIYPQSFADSNGDGVGDLPGLIEKLDYIRSLGITAIWLDPIFVSPFGDAGYDVADFKKVAPRYGTNADARRLFKEAHKRGIRVILDLVAGHTSVEHPWFKASCQHEPNKYSTYYHWTPTIWREPKVGNWVKGYAPREGNYLTNFFWFQPALNYGYANPNPENPWELPPEAPECMAVREELRSVMKFWLDAGCDGFRVDMASSLIKNDTDFKELKKLWADYRGWMETHYPEAALIAEWGNPETAIKCGFHVDFLMHFNEPAYLKLLGAYCQIDGGKRYDPVYFQREGGLEIDAFLDNYLHHYTKTKGKGFISMPTANHDFPRPSRGRTPAELRVIMAMLLTMPGVPTIYYGDEIGMRWIDGLPSKEGSYLTRTGTRTPMQWKPGKNLGFSTAAPSKLYLPVDSSADAPTVAAAEADGTSLLHLVRKLLALRREEKALGNAQAFEPVVARKKAPFIFRRGKGRSQFIIVINGKEESRTCQLPAGLKLEAVIAEGVTITGRKVEAAPLSFGIYRAL